MVECDRSSFPMIPLLLSQPSYTRYGFVWRLISSLGSPSGKAVSSAGRNNQISKELVRVYKSRCFHFIAEQVGDACGAPSSRHRVSQEDDDSTILLSDRDVDLSIVANSCFAQERVAPFRLRKLDTIFAQARITLDVLHIAETVSRTLSILAGAACLIKRAQPLIILEGESARSRSYVFELMAKWDYLIFDSLLQPLSEEISSDFYQSCMYHSEAFLLALPRCFVVSHGLTKALWPTLAEPCTGMTWKSLLTAGVISEARNGGVNFGFAPNMKSVVLKADASLICNGFYPAEESNGQSWRWLGPRCSASIQLPCLSGGLYELEIIVVGAVSDADLAGLRLFAFGRKLNVQLQMMDNLHKVVALIEMPLFVIQSEFELTISVPRTHRIGGHDPRLLGICVSHFVLTRVAG